MENINTFYVSTFAQIDMYAYKVLPIFSKMVAEKHVEI